MTGGICVGVGKGTTLRVVGTVTADTAVGVDVGKGTTLKVVGTVTADTGAGVGKGTTLRVVGTVTADIGAGSANGTTLSVVGTVTNGIGVGAAAAFSLAGGAINRKAAPAQARPKSNPLDANARRSLGPKGNSLGRKSAPQKTAQTCRVNAVVPLVVPSPSRRLRGVVAHQRIPAHIELDIVFARSLKAKSLVES